MIRAVIFDFDGTIADTFALTVREVNANAKKLGYKKVKNVEQLRDKDALHVLNKEMGIPLWKIPYIVWKGKQIAKSKITKAKLFKGIKSSIKKLEKDYFVAIITSNSKENVRIFFEKESFTVKNVFSSIMFRKELSLLKMFVKFKLKPSEIIYVGDEIRDVEACKKTKVKMIGVSWGYNTAESLKKAGVDYIAKTPNDILKIIKDQRKSL